MKTSSKLLVGLAVVLLLAPLCSIGYMYLVKGTNAERYEILMKEEGHSLTSVDNVLQTTKLQKFDRVLLTGSQRTYVSLYLIKNPDYAVKVNKGKADNLSYTLVDDRTLKIEFQERENLQMASIYIFAPDLHDVHLVNAQIAELETDVDSLTLVLEKSRNSINFGKNDKLSHLNLSLIKSNLFLSGDYKTITNLNTLQLNLDSSSIVLNPAIYNQVLIHSNASKFTLKEGNKNAQTTFKDLQLFTRGRSSFSFGYNPDQMQIDKLTGQLSDSTKIDLPIYLTRNLVGSSQ